MNSHHRLFTGRLVVPAGLLVLGIMAACGDSGSDKGQSGALDGLKDSGRPDVAQPDAAQPDAQTDAASDAPTDPPDAGPGVFKPSNLPADVCDAATTTDLVVPPNETSGLDPDGTCDRVIPQGPGLQDICVRIYSAVRIAGTYVANSGKRPTALVATKTFTLEPEGKILLGLLPVVGLSPGADARGNGTKGSGIAGGGGGGQVSSAGAPGGSAGGAGGPQYGDPASRQLIGGGYGGAGGTSARPENDPVNPGIPGAATQLVACGQFSSRGTIDATGSDGANGNVGPEHGGGGAGGGAGGMILIEAAKVTATRGQILARGGHGGAGGAVLWGGGILLYGGSCGRGGTGASAPTAGTDGEVSHDPMPPNQTSGAGGGGGAAGRILINVPRGASPELTGVEIDPPPVLGTTH